MAFDGLAEEGVPLDAALTVSREAFDHHRQRPHDPVLLGAAIEALQVAERALGLAIDSPSSPRSPRSPQSVRKALQAIHY